MTLREMFRPHTKYWDCYNDEPLKYDHENKCVKIADKFAIGFAEWCIKKRVDFFDSTEIGETYTIDGFISRYKMNELLEIYKKEKGL